MSEFTVTLNGWHLLFMAIGILAGQIAGNVLTTLLRSRFGDSYEDWRARRGR